MRSSPRLKSRSKPVSYVESPSDDGSVGGVEDQLDTADIDGFICGSDDDEEIEAGEKSAAPTKGKKRVLPFEAGGRKKAKVSQVENSDAAATVKGKAAGTTKKKEATLVEVEATIVPDSEKADAEAMVLDEEASSEEEYEYEPDERSFLLCYSDLVQYKR